MFSFPLDCLFVYEVLFTRILVEIRRMSFICINRRALFQTGEIAKELNFLSHNVRTKLDEIKRQELTRLRALVKEKAERGGKFPHPTKKLMDNTVTPRTCKFLL